MSKTSGNCVWLDDKPEDMYGKLMRLPDEHIKTYLELVTNMPLEKIDSLPNDQMKQKKILAHEVVKDFHGIQKANEAQKHFELTVQNQQIPTEIQEVSLEYKKQSLLDTLSMCSLGSSNSERKRMISQGGVKIDGKKITDINNHITPGSGATIQYGKREWRKVE